MEWKNEDFVILYAALLWTSLHNVTKICKPCTGLKILNNGVILLPDAMSYDKRFFVSNLAKIRRKYM